MDPITIAAAAGTGVVIELHKQGALKKWLQSPHKILILGSSGVGKSQFIKSIKDVIPEIIDVNDRTTNEVINSVELRQQPFEFIDVPGEESAKSYRDQTIEKHIADVKVVINVVCYGYHEYGKALRTKKEKNPFEGDEISEEFLKASRDREINTLSQWVHYITSQSEQQIRLLTVVTKADLWRPESDEIINHYEEGDYYDTLNEYCNNTIDDDLTHVVIPYCSINRNFYDKNYSTGYLDDKTRNGLRNHLFNKLVELINGMENHG